MPRAGVPESCLPVLAALKGAGAVGLFVAALVPLLGTTDTAMLQVAKLIGTAADAGVLAYFVGAIVAHSRARFYSFGPAASFLVLTIAVMVLGNQDLMFGAIEQPQRSRRSVVLGELARRPLALPSCSGGRHSLDFANSRLDRLQRNAPWPQQPR
jgi:hypothetical protein